MGQSVKAAQHPPSALPHTHTVNMTDTTWKSLVYNVDITHDQVKKIYQGWAETYDDDTAKLKAQGPGADYVVDCLTYALKKGGKNNVSKVTVLDVACGTGIVGVPAACRLQVCDRPRLQPGDAGPGPGQGLLQRARRERVRRRGAAPAGGQEIRQCGHEGRLRRRTSSTGQSRNC